MLGVEASISSPDPQTAQKLWREFSERFVRLGGVIENVELRVQNGLRGLFVKDRGRPFRINVPERLLVPVDEIVLQDGAVRVRPESGLDGEVRAFFDDYQARLSWEGGRDDAAKFLLAMYGLPDHVKALLSAEFLFNIGPDFPTEQTIYERFIDSRAITYDKKRVIMPMVELVNHRYNGVSWDFTSGIGVKGTSGSEIFARYNSSDCWGKFLVYGFSAVEPVGYSLPFEVFSRDKKTRILVRRKTRERVKSATGQDVPKVERSGNEISISYVVLGDRRDARRPLQMYRKSIRPYLDDKSDEFFETLGNLNKQKFLRLLAACNEGDSYGLRLVRETAIRQLEALNSAVYGSWC